jgi:hypothetical protein
MLSQNERDNHNAADHTNSSNVHEQASHYRVLIPQQLLDGHSNLLERVIEFAFDTLHVHRLQLRVYDGA